MCVNALDSLVDASTGVCDVPSRRWRTLTPSTRHASMNRVEARLSPIPRRHRREVRPQDAIDEM